MRGGLRCCKHPHAPALHGARVLGPWDAHLFFDLQNGAGRAERPSGKSGLGDLGAATRTGQVSGCVGDTRGQPPPLRRPPTGPWAHPWVLRAGSRHHCAGCSGRGRGRTCARRKKEMTEHALPQRHRRTVSSIGMRYTTIHRILYQPRPGMHTVPAKAEAACKSALPQGNALRQGGRRRLRRRAPFFVVVNVLWAA